MSAAGNAGPGTGPAATDDEAPGLWGSLSTALRLIVGWCSVTVAVLNLLAEIERVPDRAYLLFHVLLLIGGLLLISFGWGGAGAGPVGRTAGGAVLAGGMLISALPVNDAVCCLTAFAVRHGYPFSFVARHEGGRWHLDGPHLIADLFFWGYAGLLVLALVTLTRRGAKHHGAARD
jgi:hypothetical protein